MKRLVEVIHIIILVIIAGYDECMFNLNTKEAMWWR